MSRWKEIEDFLELMEKIYARAGLRAAAVSPETGYFLHSLVRLTKPEVIVEIGTHRGVSALWMARALKENLKGHLYTIDIYLQTSMAEAQDLIKSAGLSDFVTFIKAPSVPDGVNYCKKNNLKIDILFIDGNHNIEPCAADLMGFWQYVKQEGLVILHDTKLDSGWRGPISLCARLTLPSRKNSLLDL